MGPGSASVFTRYLVAALRGGRADLDEDGDIALDELYSYVHERVVAEMPQQRPKKQDDVEGRIIIARNVHWTLPALSPARDGEPDRHRAAERACDGLAHLHRDRQRRRPRRGRPSGSPGWPPTTAGRCRRQPRRH